MKLTRFISVLALSTLYAGVAHAEYKPGNTGYSQFVNLTPPSVDNSNLKTNSTMLCYDTFCSYESGTLRIPVYSAEHLTAEQIHNAKGASRKSLSFYPDPHIPAEYSSKVSDFTGTGYDRGHMAPWADSADPDCFTLANILPQMADNNRHLWEGIETSVRNLSLQYNDVYVVSGPIFSKSVVFMNERVAIPDHLYKAVYIPALHKTSVYLVANANGEAWVQIDLDTLYKLTHVNQFPSLSSNERLPFQLPEPDQHGKHIPQYAGNIFDPDLVTNSVGESYEKEKKSHEGMVGKSLKEGAGHVIKNLLKGF